jgi:hypothetical protein
VILQAASPGSGAGPEARARDDPGGASGASGAPSASLTTTKANSLVFAVGNDWDRAVARTLPGRW